MGRHRVIGGTKVALDFTEGDFVLTSSGSHTLSGVSIGAAGKRHVILGVWSSGGVITSVNIGGAAGSLIHSSGNLRLYGAELLTGTSVNIGLSASSSMGLVGYGVWAAYDLKSLTAVDTITNASTITGGTLTARPRGCAFALAVDVCPADENPAAFSMSGMTIDAQPAFTAGVPKRRLMFASALTPSTSLSYSTAPIANSTGTNDSIISASLR